MAGNSWQQPVAGEPSLGTPHREVDTNNNWLYSNTSPTINTWYEVDFSGCTEVGVRMVAAEVMQNTLTSRVYWSDVNTASFHESLVVDHVNSASRSGGQKLLPLNSARKGYIGCDNASQDLYVAYPTLKFC